MWNCINVESRTWIRIFTLTDAVNSFAPGFLFVLIWDWAWKIPNLANFLIVLTFSSSFLFGASLLLNKNYWNQVGAAKAGAIKKKKKKTFFVNTLLGPRQQTIEMTRNWKKKKTLEENNIGFLCDLGQSQHRKMLFDESGFRIVQNPGRQSFCDACVFRPFAEPFTKTQA